MVGAAIGAAASIAGGVMASNAAGKAAKTQANAAAEATALQREMFDRQVELQAPFRAGGLTAQNRLMTLLGLTPTTTDGASGLNIDPNSPDYGKYARDFNMSDYQADPGYAFRLKEGMKALDAQAAQRGGLISGAALKAANRYGQDYASNEYTNAFNRYQTNRSNQLQPLQSLMGAGQTATNATGNAAGAYGAAAGSNALAAGNALASGAVGSANAWNSALGGVAKAFNSSTYGGGGYGGGYGYNGVGSGSMSDLQNTSVFSGGGYNPSLFG
jgi:hypothetical protein